MELLQSAVSRKIQNPKHLKLFEQYLTNVPTGLSVVNVVQEITALKRSRIGQKLASALVAGKSQESITALIQDYIATSSANILPAGSTDTGAVKAGWDPEELVKEKFSPENLIKLTPKTLNDRASGGVLPGDHLVIFALTEMGKTLFAINLCSGFLKQGLKVLYVGNEEPVARVSMRMVSRLSGISSTDIRNLKEFEPLRETIYGQGYGNFYVKDLSPGTLGEITKLVDEVKPQVLVVDQLRNLQVESESRVNQLDRAATGIRNIGKSKGLVAISLTQASDSARNKAILDSGDVDYSNVGIPGQADMLIGFGGTEDQISQGVRCISFPKNKNDGELSHVPFYVTINPQTSKITEL
jgi:archaellum biogenesis ATPase FlaH